MRVKQIIASTLVGALFVNQTLLASGVENAFWKERRVEQRRRSSRSDVGLLARAQFGSTSIASAIPVAEKVSFHTKSFGSAVRSLSPRLTEDYRDVFGALPSANMTIRKLTLPPDGKPRGIVYYIQDVHKNREAQQNIARTITRLMESPPVASRLSLLGLEGAFNPYDFSYLRSFPDPVAAQLAAEELLYQHEMSGPIYSVLTTTGPIPSVVGVDDPVHYNANVEAYRRALPTQVEQKSYVLKQRAEIESQKTRVFNGSLIKYDQQVQAYYRGELSLGAYVKMFAEDKNVPLGGALKPFVRALRLEETLDLKKVETERALLLEVLAKTLDQSRVDALVAHSVAYRSGELSYGDFYRWLESLCVQAGIRLSNFPAMETYVRYVLAAEGIDAEQLFHDLNRRERDLYSARAVSKEEKDLIRVSRNLTLIEKLLDFSLTPEEWAEYQNGREARRVDLEPYETFYREAHARDQTMADRFVQAVVESLPSDLTAKPPLSILVTGGYHSPGITTRLVNAGMAVVSVVPKIKTVDTTQGSAYLSVFAQEKTPLDRLFEGSKLFVADNPLSGNAAARQLLLASVLTTQPGKDLPHHIREFLSRKIEGVSLIWNGWVAQVHFVEKGKKYFFPVSPKSNTGDKAHSLQESPSIGAGIRAGWGHVVNWLRKAISLLFGVPNPSEVIPESTKEDPSPWPPLSELPEPSQKGNKQRGFVRVDFDHGIGRLLDLTEPSSEISSSEELSWEALLNNDRFKKYAIVLKPNGEFEIHPRLHQASDHKDLYEAMRRVLDLQERINVGFGGKVDEDGFPIPGRFFLNEGHADVVLYSSDGTSRPLHEGESLVEAMSDPHVIFAAIQNPARAKRDGGGNAGKSPEQVNADPASYSLRAENLLEKFALELVLIWVAKDGTKWWFTPNPAAYFPNDPQGAPLSQLDQMTFSQSESGAPQSEISSLSSLTAIFEALEAVNSSQSLKDKDITLSGMIAAVNGWFSEPKDENQGLSTDESKPDEIESGASQDQPKPKPKLGRIKAGASQNVAHAHFLRIILPIENAPRIPIGEVGPVSVSVLGDPQNGPALVLEAKQENRDQLVKVLFHTIKDITDRGLSYNFIIRQTSDGFRVFIAEKVRGVPTVRFPNEFAFFEVGRTINVERLDHFNKLTDDQKREMNDPETNLTEWIKKEKKEGRLSIVDPKLLEDIIAAIVSVSASADAIEALADRVLKFTPETLAQSGKVELDSLFSRFLRNKETGATSQTAGVWRVGRWVNDFLGAPVYETGFFFLMPFLLGSYLGLGLGLIAFVGFHFWDDYKGALETGLSPPGDYRQAVGSLVPRVLRAGLLYALPFVLFGLGPWTGSFDVLTSFLSESPYHTALGVALLHSARNAYTALSRWMEARNLQSFNWNWKSMVVLFAVWTPQLAWASLTGAGDNGLLVDLVTSSSGVVLFFSVWGLMAFYVSTLFGRVVGNDGENHLIDRVKRAGLPHEIEDALLGEAAIQAENFETALKALFATRHVHSVAPRVIEVLRKMGQGERAKAIESRLAFKDRDQLLGVQENGDSVRVNATRMARVVAGYGSSVRENLTEGQREILDLFNHTFPHPDWFHLDSLDPRSLPLGLIRNVGEDLTNPQDVHVFDESFTKGLAEPNSGPLTATNVLQRLRTFVDSEPNGPMEAAEQENRVPVEMQIVTMADMDLVRDTLTRLQSINAGEAGKVYLLLMGADSETVGALQKAAKGIPFVGVGPKPVAHVAAGQSSPWVNPTQLGHQYNWARKKLNLPKGIDLAVSVSESVVFSQEEMKNVRGLDDVLRAALLRYLTSLPLRLADFNTMLRVIQKTKESA
ncbi:MAG: hypothetical protein JNK54_02155 [Elusimicrobia bacterium]|nr:hypothetical protein [Elusimicrobiota bacterium]